MEAPEPSAVPPTGGVSLCTGFLRSAERFPERPALALGGSTYSYLHVATVAGRVREAVLASADDAPYVAILARRSLPCYAGLLGALAAGRGYAPLNPTYPVLRTARMLNASGARTLVLGREAEQYADAVLAETEATLTVLAVDLSDLAALETRHARHRFVPIATGPEGAAVPPAPAVEPGAPAYVMFTSGTTGMPKGVVISHASARTYVEWVVGHYAPCEHDRFSQMFETTFDISVHDMFVCWESGACLYVPSDAQMVSPPRFIVDSGLTFWASVPAAAQVAMRLRLLRPGAFPSLRTTVFGGAPLPLVAAEAWARAAPNSVIENLYGPTEATVLISHMRYDPRTTPARCVNGIVPIGWPFDGSTALVVDPHTLAPRPVGEPGELLLGGPQLAEGYLHDPEKTAAAFIGLPDAPGTRWYRTGDVVRQEPDGCLVYLGRADEQVKLRGYRVELQEIDHALQEALGSPLALCVAWPPDTPDKEAVYGFVAGSEETDVAALLRACRTILPDYMVPRSITVRPELPLNANGKLDRKALLAWVEEMMDGSRPPTGNAPATGGGDDR